MQVILWFENMFWEKQYTKIRFLRFFFFFSGAQAGVLTFSTVDRASFEAIDKWRAKVEEEVGPIPLVLVQNKIDLVEEAVLEP